MVSSDFKQNIKAALAAQVITTLTSVLITLIVSKVLGVQQFAYWQLFMFYGNYIVLSQLGLTDGVYLRYGGAQFDEFDTSLLGSQFKFMVCALLLMSLIIIFAALTIPGNADRKIVWCLIAVSLLISNCYWFIGGLFQATGRNRVYSISVIINKVIFIGGSMPAMPMSCIGAWRFWMGESEPPSTLRRLQSICLWNPIRLCWMIMMLSQKIRYF